MSDLVEGNKLVGEIEDLKKQLENLELLQRENDERYGRAVEFHSNYVKKCFDDVNGKKKSLEVLSELCDKGDKIDKKIIAIKKRIEDLPV